MLFLLPIFIGAFLLFQVQPLIAKTILPFFGGGAAVWTACLLFFQAFLLLGYLYAHLLFKLSSLRKQFLIHSLLLIFSLFFLPLGMSDESILIEDTSPLVGVLVLLAKSIGLPYLVLSATGPLVQRWFTLLYTDKMPYRLYSWSNLSSMLALLTFPFIFEPLFSIDAQSIFWSITYTLYAGTIAGVMVKLAKVLPKTVPSKLDKDSDVKMHRTRFLLWVILSALGVIFLVSTTNAMTQNIPPVPFLWILPLCIYLLSFVICFHSPKWYVTWYWFLLFIPTALIAIFMFYIGSQFDITSQIVIYSSILFTACMICHGELAKLKPNNNWLTHYYLSLAFGGFLGSMFVAFVAQNIFTQFLEFPLAIIAVFIVFALTQFQHHKLLTRMGYASISLSIFCMLALWLLNEQYVKTDVFSARNFYGVLSVKDIEIEGVKERRLIDGTTSHGTQYLAKKDQNIPLSYYRKNTGVAIALEQFSELNRNKNKPLNVGLIGLGAGTLAAYGNHGDNYHFYELNPAVIDAAKRYFSYIDDAKADIKIIAGDGRVSLNKELIENEQGNGFDVLIIDAFSGDSIPQHLLTVEAMSLYWQHLAENGVIVVHISNSHLNLLPLMQGMANKTGKSLRYFNTKSTISHSHDTEWLWLTNNQQLLESTDTHRFQSEINIGNKALVIWTDNFSNLFSLLK